MCHTPQPKWDAKIVRFCGLIYSNLQLNMGQISSACNNPFLRRHVVSIASPQTREACAPALVIAGTPSPSGA
jgi:hypothetical protein